VRFEKIVLPKELLFDLIQRSLQSLPRKTYGMFLSSMRHGMPEEFHIFESNIRNTPEWKSFFESYGEHHIKHDDAGFVVDPQELLEFYEDIQSRNMIPVGLFHTHKRHQAIFSQIDRDLHCDSDLWHLIISIADPSNPDVRAYCIEGDIVYETRIIIA